MSAQDERDDRIDAYVLGTMAADERTAFERELRHDPALATDVRAVHSVAIGLLRAVPQVSPPVELRARVLRAATGYSAGESARDRVPPPGLAAPHSEAPRHAPLAWPAWVAAAASIAVALGLGSYTVRLKQDVSALQARLDAATSRLADAESSVARMERVVSEAQSQTAVLSAPDLAQVALAGQPAAPDARARAFWSRSRGLVFTASQLPPLPSGRSYQLWVVTANARISAGVLALAGDGRVLHIVQTPADIPTPVAMAVTLEPEGGVPQPTGAFYLLGTTGL